MTAAAAPLAVACLACRYQFDSATQVGGEAPVRPHVGSVSLCLNCGHLAIWTAYGLRQPTDVELAEIMGQREVALSVGYIRTRGLFR